MMNELSGRQRLELALLEDDVSEALKLPEPVPYIAALAALAKYARAEGLTQAHFKPRGDTHSLINCYTVVGIVTNPESFLESPGCLGSTVLFASGLVPITGGGPTTRAEGRERLLRDGWTFDGVNEEFRGENPDEDVEIWTRGAGAAREWCELLHLRGLPNVAHEASWARFTTTTDPRAVVE